MSFHRLIKIACLSSVPLLPIISIVKTSKNYIDLILKYFIHIKIGWYITDYSCFLVGLKGILIVVLKCDKK